MDSEDIAKGSALLARFESGGFTTLVNDELRSLSAYLENEATETARAGPLCCRRFSGSSTAFSASRTNTGAYRSILSTNWTISRARTLRQRQPLTPQNRQGSRESFLTRFGAGYRDILR